MYKHKQRGNTDVMPPKAMVYGTKSVSQAVVKICELFGLIVINEAQNGKAVSDILIVADGEEMSEKPIISGNERLIYLESNDKNTVKHNLYFLTQLLPTYRIPLEKFSIVELARIIADIKMSIK